MCTPPAGVDASDDSDDDNEEYAVFLISLSQELNLMWLKLLGMLNLAFSRVCTYTLTHSMRNMQRYEPHVVSLLSM